MTGTPGGQQMNTFVSGPEARPYGKDPGRSTHVHLYVGPRTPYARDLGKSTNTHPCGGPGARSPKSQRGHQVYTFMWGPGAPTPRTPGRQQICTCMLGPGTVRQGHREFNKYTHLCGARGREVNKLTPLCGARGPVRQGPWDSPSIHIHVGPGGPSAKDPRISANMPRRPNRTIWTLRTKRILQHKPKQKPNQNRNQHRIYNRKRSITQNKNGIRTEGFLPHSGTASGPSPKIVLVASRTLPKPKQKSKNRPNDIPDTSNAKTKIQKSS
jgi:hypothetical protein